MNIPFFNPAFNPKQALDSVLNAIGRRQKVGASKVKYTYKRAEGRLVTEYRAKRDGKNRISRKARARNREVTVGRKNR